MDSTNFLDRPISGPVDQTLLLSQDRRSRHPLPGGYTVTFLHSLKQAVMCRSLPDKLYTDQGRPFVSNDIPPSANASTDPLGNPPITNPQSIPSANAPGAHWRFPQQSPIQTKYNLRGPGINSCGTIRKVARSAMKCLPILVLALFPNHE